MFLLARLENLLTDRASGRVLRKALPQEWGQISLRIKLALNVSRKACKQTVK